MAKEYQDYETILAAFDLKIKKASIQQTRLTAKI